MYLDPLAKPDCENTKRPALKTLLNCNYVSIISKTNIMLIIMIIVPDAFVRNSHCTVEIGQGGPD